MHPLQQREGVVRSVGWQTFALWLYLFACLSTQKSTLRHSSLTSLLVSSTDQETILTLCPYKEFALETATTTFTLVAFLWLFSSIGSYRTMHYVQIHTISHWSHWQHWFNTKSVALAGCYQCPLISLYSSPVLSQKLAKWPRISHSGHIVTDSLTSC